ncbi:MAG: hypothetical protein HZB20_06720 [Chloroflexi bacterium]|nr:hypothetical protein [Chloroflexota bacterium]MBI5829225.1 hypothetical protein [Chloroflexota bacterium]
MPRLSAIFIRTALGYLAAGFTFGALMLFNKGVPLGPWVWRLLPLHIECVLVGWTVQLAMGVAFWILPRFGLGPRRGNESLGWVAYGLINAGVLAVGLGQALAAPAFVVVLGRAAGLLAAAAYAAHAWPRVKPLARP